jgi:hypothetical protein
MSRFAYLSMIQRLNLHPFCNLTAADRHSGVDWRATVDEDGRYSFPVAL